MTESYVYQRVMLVLTEDIKKGIFGPHQQLPTETKLSKRYDCSRLTIRKAIDSLVQKQLLVRYRNHGTYIVPFDQKISSGKTGLVSFSEAAKQADLTVKTHVLKFKSVVEVPQDIRERLKLSNGSQVWEIQRLRLANDSPMTLERVFLKQQVVPNLTRQDAQQSLFASIEERFLIGYSDEEIGAVLLNSQNAELLEAKQGDAAFLVHAVTYALAGYPMMADDSLYRADKYTFHNILYREPNVRKTGTKLYK